MRFLPTAIEGVWILELEPIGDARGFFARTFCREAFAARGMNAHVSQCNLSYNAERGTLRGMHWQSDPAPEAKVVRCVRGALHDVVVDVREGSPTRHRHVGVELSAANRRALYVPEHVAHGFQTLEDDTEILYQISAPYTPEAARGLRHDDPALGIDWPLPPAALSPRDAAWPLLGDG